MRLFYTIGVYFYVTVLTLLGILMISFAVHLIQPQDITATLDIIYDTYNSRLIAGLAGILLILLTISFAQVLTGKMQKERTIAFNNPSGQVTIALSAVEDLIKRLTTEIPEIKESRSDVIASKKGLEVELRIILRSETNIPDLTNSLQEMVKSKLQETLGLEETITVKVHVAKISLQETKTKEKKENTEVLRKPSIPFQGYGR